MRVGAGNSWRRMAHVALLTGVLAGCSDGEETAHGASTPSARPSSTTAATGGTMGAVGSACELPVTFDIAKSWTAESVEAPLRQGPVSLACEVDAKPAGNIGYLRVWAGEPGTDDTQKVLEAFVAAEDGASKAQYRSFKAGEFTGVEVEYLYTGELLDESKKESAFAVTTADGPVVVHLGGLDTEEHEEMLPAYELAQRTLRIA
ncbi:lipoprotein [Streptomyces sp. NPDC019531]|uniref:lipoprotein n=1 Tax=Streptomyces sp. NPDC019531 TaxID=3365062 RepID=UPI00384BC3C3